MVDLDKKIKICALADVYINLLTPNQQQVLKDYYYNDLSLFEIAENLGITRQAVRDTLIKAEAALIEYEAKCKILAQNAKLKQQLTDLINMAKSGKKTTDEFTQTLSEIVDNL